MKTNIKVNNFVAEVYLSENLSKKIETFLSSKKLLECILSNHVIILIRRHVIRRRQNCIYSVEMKILNKQ